MASTCQPLHFMANLPCLTSSSRFETVSAAGFWCGIIPWPAPTCKSHQCLEE